MLDSFRVEVLQFDDSLFEWSCRLWDYDFESCYGFRLQLFADTDMHPDWNDFDELLHLVKISTFYTKGRGGERLKIGFRMDFVHTVASGAELLPRNPDLTHSLTSIGKIHTSRPLKQVAMDGPLYAEYANETYDMYPVAFASKDTVMEIFGEEHIGSSQSDIPIEVIIFGCLERIFNEDDFSVGDVLRCCRRLLGNQFLGMTHYSLCSKVACLKEYISRVHLIGSDVILLGGILGELEKISSSDESPALLRSLATKAESDMVACLPCLVKGAVGDAPSGCGGGGGRER